MLLLLLLAVLIVLALAAVLFRGLRAVLRNVPWWGYVAGVVALVVASNFATVW